MLKIDFAKNPVGFCHNVAGKGCINLSFTVCRRTLTFVNNKQLV